MLLSIDLTSETPLYQQLRDRVVEAIASGTLPAGSGLHATRRLAAEFGINFHTVNKAYDLLRQEGFVRLTRKQGAVVQRDPASGPPAAGFADAWQARARTLLAEAVAQGLTPDQILDACRAVLAGFESGTAGETPSPGEGLRP